MMAHVVQDSPGPVPDSPSRSSQYRYYEGFVEKKGPKDKTLERRWAILEGDRMHYYQQKVGNRELSTQKALDTLQLDRNTSATPEAKDRCRMTIKCKQGNYKIKASSAEELEGLWLKVVAVSTAIIPKERDLLPGQKQMFADIALKEIDRKQNSGGDGTPKKPPLKKAATIGVISSTPTPNSRHSAPAGGQWDESDLYKFYPDHLKLQLPTPPPWFFHKISRDHAEQILLKNSDQGHLLIRVSESHPGEFSLSVRQDVGGIVVKHYRFRWEENTFRLLIDEQQPELSTMYDLIMFFIERSGGNLKPIQTRDPKVLKLPDNLYEHRFAQLTQGINPENGEAPYRNRLSIQRAKTVNNGRQESTYLIPENSATDINSGSSRPNRVSLPASFNQSYPGQGISSSLPSAIPEGVPTNDFTPNRVVDRSQSVRVAGSNGYCKDQPNTNNGYMIMSSQQRQQMMNLEKDAYINYRPPDADASSDLPIRPLPAVPADGPRKRSISASALPTGFVPEITNNHKSSDQSAQPNNLTRPRAHTTSTMHDAPPPSLPPRNTNTDAEFDNGSFAFRARTRSSPASSYYTQRGLPLPGLASESQLRRAFDQLGIDKP